jgi:hypothetical protein
MRKRTMVVWIMALAISISVHAITAAMPSVGLHALVSAMITLVIAVLAVRENERALTADSDAFELASTNAHYMAVVWAWAGLTITLTYASVMHWSSWWYYAMPIGGAAVLCLCFANLMVKGSEGTTATRALKLARFLALVQLVGAVAVIAGLIATGKLVFASSASTAALARDWAANDIFFFGATALAVISAVSIKSYNRALGADPAGEGVTA